MSGPVIIKVGGALLDDAKSLAAVLDAAARMHSARPGSVVIVHGGGCAVDRHLAQLSMATQKRDGIRITPVDQMVQIGAVLGGIVNQRIVGALLAKGSRAVGISLADGFLTSAAKATHYSFDPGQVGTVHGGDPGLIDSLTGSGYLPVISSVAMDAHGELLNINADDAAAAIARIVGASALLLLTDVPGVLDGEGLVIPDIDPARAEELIASGTLSGGMIPKIRSALATAAATGVPVVIAGWRDAAALAKLSSGQRVGTAVLPATRVMEAAQ